MGGARRIIIEKDPLGLLRGREYNGVEKIKCRAYVEAS